MNAEQAFPARMDALPQAAALVARFCAAHAISGATALRLSLVVEELFTNIVQHGYAGDVGGTIELALGCDPQGIRLVCVDRAPAFDPRPLFARAPADLGQPAELRKVGGLGSWLVASLASVEHFERSDGANRLTLRMPCASPGG